MFRPQKIDRNFSVFESSYPIRLAFAKSQIQLNMPPKRSTSRPTRGAKRGRGGGRSRGVKDQARVLSDITEESESQPHESSAAIAVAVQQRSKKRSFQGTSSGQDGRETTVPITGRETRSQAAKRTKLYHEVTEPVDTQETQGYEDSSRYQPLATRITPPSSPYSPSPALLSFAQLYDLDTNTDTDIITLNLIDLTLTEANWHPGLSGMIQPAACFLVASLLTRRQNLVEDIAASVQTFGVEYEDLVEGYRLLWQWQENLGQVVGAYEQSLDELPDPLLLLASGPFDEYVGGEVIHEEEAFDERPEPERWE